MINSTKRQPPVGRSGARGHVLSNMCTFGFECFDKWMGYGEQCHDLLFQLKTLSWDHA